MSSLKYSRQRESIKEYLNGSCEHPTADMVYMSVKQEFPNISLGTVYRNLNTLFVALFKIFFISLQCKNKTFVL